MNITEFLLARIAEDEAVAKDGPFPHPKRFQLENVETDEGMFVAIDPSRVLAECEAKRAIIADCEGWASADCNYGRCQHRADDADGGEDHWRGKFGWRTLADLAVVCADHPDYRQEWAL